MDGTAQWRMPKVQEGKISPFYAKAEGNCGA